MNVYQPEKRMLVGTQPFLPAYANSKRFNGPLFFAYIALHLTLLAVPFTYTWQGLTSALVIGSTTFCLGITLCYHRLLSHRSYQLPRPLMLLFAYLGCLKFSAWPHMVGGHPPPAPPKCRSARRPPFSSSQLDVVPFYMALF